MRPGLVTALVAGAALVAGCPRPAPEGTGGGPATSSSSSGTGAGSSTSSTSSSSSGASDAGPPEGVTLVQAGTFQFFDENTGNMTAATLTKAFYLDTYEVTVSRFKAWVDAGQPAPCASGTCSLDPGGPYEAAMTWTSSWNAAVAMTAFQSTASCNNANGDPSMPTFTLASGGAFPIVCVSWYQAAAFCAFEGKRLPTETEWQYAATGRGATPARTYPWGGTVPVDCTLATWSLSPASHNGCKFPLVGGKLAAGVTLDGIYDMAGSVAEWTWDWVANYPSQPVTDYAGPASGTDRSVRGGSWASDVDSLRATSRNHLDLAEIPDDVGMRCAKTKL